MHAPPHPCPDLLVTGLRRPEAYPWRPGSVEVIETHISWVMLAGDFVVKVKRPVRFGFVDHSTVERRRTSCEEEVRLNRRLTRGVYLDVVPIMREAGGFAVEGIGPAVEWATLMRRLPANGMLDRLLARGDAPADLTDRLADRLIPFHSRIAPACGFTPAGRPAALLRVVTDNLDELRPFADNPLSGERIERIDAAMRGFIAAHRALFDARGQGGFVRDGHGDLRCEHICLDGEELQIFDCVEFSPVIRCADVASDLAFLLMDLARYDAGRIGEDLAERYRAAGIELPPPLLRFYTAHRALVRAKVACLTHPDLHPAALPGLRREAVEFLDHATRSVYTARPALVAMSGLSGTGKSTAAEAIARATGASVIASDAVRKELAGVHGPAAAEWRQGIYSPAWTELTYGRLFDLARERLRSGGTVVLDAAFLSDEQRLAAANLAREARVPLLLVEVVCDERVARARIEARAASGESRSDADWEIYRRQRAIWEAGRPVVPAGGRLVTVNASRDDPGWIEPVLNALEGAGVLVPNLGADQSG